MLELKNISWSLPDGREVIKDVSLSIPKGKLVVVTGPNGGGKTTLAKIIAGIAMPDAQNPTDIAAGGWSAIYGRWNHG